MTSTKTPNFIFQKILEECEAAQQHMQHKHFVTDEGLRVRINRQNLPAELQGETTRGLELYLVKQNARHCLQEIGRLREEAFRRVGGGTHQEIDLDHWDHSGFWQLLCIDREEQEICGAYRLLYGARFYRNKAPEQVGIAKEMGSVHSLFDFTPLMLEKILPRSLELGRSFVNENARRSHRALPLLFEALGQIICQNADFVLGKVTFYPDMLDAPTLWLLDSFLEYYWGCERNPFLWNGMPQPDLGTPRPGLDFRPYIMGPHTKESPIQPCGLEPEELKQLSGQLRSRLPQRFSRNAMHQLLAFLDDFYQSGASDTEQAKLAKQQGKKSKSAVLRAMALFLKYVSLLRKDVPGNSAMHTFGGAINPHFGNVIEFMSMVEVRYFHRSNLDRWMPGPPQA